MRKPTILILLLIPTLLYTVNTYVYSAEIADEGGSFEYDAADRRDPFMPLVTRDGKMAFGYGAINSIEDINLEGIVYDPKGDSIAIINGLVLKENDMIGNIKLIKIESNKVTLLFKQTEHIVSLEE